MTVQKSSKRRAFKRWLAAPASKDPAPGLTVLVYHRISGGTPDERDLPLASFRQQLDVLAAHRVLSLDDALDELDAGDERSKVVLTFDDGFADVHEHAWPLLVERSLPFVVYLATAYVGGTMHWDGSTASAPGPGLTWEQIEAMVASGLCTLGNHTHTHARPENLSEEELDRCTEAIRDRLSIEPSHFAYPWGIPVVGAEPLLRARFRSTVTGTLGRNRSDTDRHRLRRIPVRQSDPIEFFAAKLNGQLLPERAYGAAVRVAKAVTRVG